TNASGGLYTGPASIAAVAPALFSANATGQGPAAALVVRTSADGAQTIQPAFECRAGACTPLPIDLGNEQEQVALSLFGTGIRNIQSPASLSVRIGESPASVIYAGAQGVFLGLDQINILLSRELAGKGEAPLRLSADGQFSNVVTIAIR